MNPEFSGQIFENNIQIQNFTKILPVGAELFLADRRTDMMKSFAFRNFANAPKNDAAFLTQVLAVFVINFSLYPLSLCNLKLYYSVRLTLKIVPPRSNLRDSS